MFKLLVKHTELNDLTFSLKEFNYHLKAGDIRNVSVYKLVLRVRMLGKSFYINLKGA